MERNIYNHLCGLRDLAAHPLPVVQDAEVEGRSLDVESIKLFSVLMEVHMEEALASLPPSLHPSIPPLVGITFYSAKESPIGAFNLAVFGLGCRTGIKPRMLTLAAFCDTDAALDFFGRGLGYPVRKAKVALSERTDSVQAIVELDGRAILDVVSINPVDIVGAGAALKMWTPINSIRTEEGDKLVQNEMTYTFHQLRRGKPRLDRFDADALNAGDLKPYFPVVGAMTTVDIAFHPTRFLLDMDVMAEAGGVTFLRKAAAA